jgi:hypothetical protein
MSITTLGQFECPQCQKRRLYRPLDFKSNSEKTEHELPTGEKISFFKDLCDFCQRKLYIKYFAPKKADAQKVLSALENERAIGEKSLEEML